MRTVIKNGLVATASDTFAADILVNNGRITLIGEDFNTEGAEVVDASGKYIFPGGIDVHTHLDMPFAGTVTADDFESGTRAAACGGTTCVIDFCVQSKGQTLGQALEDWHRRADGRAVIDYSFHLALTDLRDDVLREIPSVVEKEGVTSFKCFMAYKGALMIDDSTLFAVLTSAKECGALVGVHCENGDVIDLLVKKMLAEGKTAPVYHALSRPPQAEGEATGRAIALAEIAGAPIYIVHMSALQALNRVREARAKGLPVYAETCPHYLYLLEDNLREPGFAGAKYVMSPPLRTLEHQQSLWQGLASGDIQVVATDHGSFNFKGQKDMGLDSFAKIPNGVPGAEERLYLLYQGVANKRLSLNRMIDAFATAPAKLFGLYPRKGTIAIGADADLVVFDPLANFELSAKTLHHRVDYTCYEGFKGKGKPVLVMSRGRMVVSDDKFTGTAGYGVYVKRSPGEMSPVARIILPN